MDFAAATIQGELRCYDSDKLNIDLISLYIYYARVHCNIKPDTLFLTEQAERTLARECWMQDPHKTWRTNGFTYGSHGSFSARNQDEGKKPVEIPTLRMLFGLHIVVLPTLAGNTLIVGKLVPQDITEKGE